MPRSSPLVDQRDLGALVALAGETEWSVRLETLRDRAAGGPRAGQALRQRHAVELTIERMRQPGARPQNLAERLVVAIGAELAALPKRLSAAGQVRLEAMLREALTGEATLIPLFHLVRTAMRHRGRGFEVGFPGLEDGAPFDLLLTRDGVEAEVACDVFSAEEGRGVHRGAWFRLADRIDPDLQTWLADHPGRYLLKMTLPQGLRGGLGADADGEVLARLHDRIRVLLQSRTRHNHDEAIVLRLDPLLLAGAQAAELGLLSSLRQQFGPEAHLAVTIAADSVFVMAARAGQEDEIASAIRRRLAAIAPARLTGTRPGIIATFVEDTDRGEWRGLRDRLELEGEARRFLTDPEARPVVALSFVSRLELFGARQPDAAPEGELRFRNPGHPAARTPALAPSVLSSE